MPACGRGELCHVNFFRPDEGRAAHSLQRFFTCNGAVQDSLLSLVYSARKVLAFGVGWVSRQGPGGSHRRQGVLFYGLTSTRGVELCGDDSAVAGRWWRWMVRVWVREVIVYAWESIHFHFSNLRNDFLGQGIIGALGVFWRKGPINALD